MAGIAALFAFVLAFIFHAYSFVPNHWFDWTGLMLLGLVLLTLHALLGGGVPFEIRKK